MQIFRNPSEIFFAGAEHKGWSRHLGMQGGGCCGGDSVQQVQQVCGCGLSLYGK